MKTSAPASASSALPLALGIRALGEGRLVRREAGTAAVDRTLAVAPDDATGSGGEETSVVAIPCADPRRHDLHVLDSLADDLQRVHEGGEDDDRGAVLVVVEDGDVELFPQARLDLEAARGRCPRG